MQPWRPSRSHPSASRRRLPFVSLRGRFPPIRNLQLGGSEPPQWPCAAPQNQTSHSERFGNPLSLNDPASSFCILHSAFCISPPLVGTARRAPAEGHHGDPG